MRFLLSLFACCSLPVFLWTCNSSPEKLDLSSNNLEGHWELTRGFRNQRETHTLHGTYFLFSPDGKLTTNLPITVQEPLPYELSGRTIRHHTSPMMTYEVLEFTDTTLIVTLSWHGIPFELHFRRTQVDTVPKYEQK
ncbi:MAG: hypothetical protein NZM43_12825 [Saprospiraceae bacterium]|nr:hypothetical protein [Saprospiraceae bacterium]MDW8485197.1 hypothetical protein [Saprospiraceae bacterium]